MSVSDLEGMLRSYRNRIARMRKRFGQNDDRWPEEARERLAKNVARCEQIQHRIERMRGGTAALGATYVGSFPKHKFRHIERENQK